MHSETPQNSRKVEVSREYIGLQTSPLVTEHIGSHLCAKKVPSQGRVKAHIIQVMITDPPQCCETEQPVTQLGGGWISK